MRNSLLRFTLFVLRGWVIFGYNFDFEGIQLSEADVTNYPEIAFGDPEDSPPVTDTTGCKVYPGDSDWPTQAQWARFNQTLGGALIKGVPAAAVCYPGPAYDEARCSYVRSNWFSANFFTEDPAVPMQQWQIGDGCPLPPEDGPVTGTCKADGQAAYIVNATTVKHVQLAVNFARNQKLRLTIKNSGHDFSCRSAGGGALSIWTHHLKAFEYHPLVNISGYSGKAASIGGGMQNRDMSPYTRKYGITLPMPGGSTVGILGGWAQGGGHSSLTSYYGMMSDHILSFEVVTADGRFVHADLDENADLFWAMRGGGGSTFGVLTSAVAKVHNSIPVSSGSVSFSTPAVSDKVFWSGIHVYHAHVVRLCDAKGIGFNYIRSVPATETSNRTYSFTSSLTLPGMTAKEANEFMAPLLSDLRAVGIPPSSALSMKAESRGSYEAERAAAAAPAPGDFIQTRHMSSRLFLRENLEDPTSGLFNDTIQAIKDLVVDGGYTFHSINHAPTEEVAGHPGIDSALNPPYRKTVTHASAYDDQSYDVSPAKQVQYHARLNEYMQKWRDVTPGSGSYMNEADVGEPDFQESFYGDNYDRLLRIKQERDPWGLFYAPTAVGSEYWEVTGTDGLPTQNGRLCRVE